MRLKSIPKKCVLCFAACIMLGSCTVKDGEVIDDSGYQDSAGSKYSDAEDVVKAYLNAENVEGKGYYSTALYGEVLIMCLEKADGRYAVKISPVSETELSDTVFYVDESVENVFDENGELIYTIN